MTTHEWFIEHRTSFVIRSLEPDEERSFREHVPGCPECRAELERIEQELAWLPMGAGPVTPRPGLTRSLVDNAIGIRRAESRWLVPMGLAASLVIALGSLGWARSSIENARAEFARQHSSLQEELAMARDTLGIIQTAAKVRYASITMGKQEGGLVIFADEKTHRWNVVVYGLPAPAPGEVCQFWFITDQGMVKGVQVKSDPRGPAFMTLPMPGKGGNVMGAALTMEPADSKMDRPMGTQLAKVML
jgi:hypothetical protein